MNASLLPRRGPLVARGGRLIVWWRALREVEPLLKGYVRLARAETALAAASVKGASTWLAIGVFGSLVLMMSGTAALLVLLRERGLPLWAAFAWIAAPSILLAIIGFVMGTMRLERCTLPQTRRRVQMLAELIDEER
jgi:hypothetical protein